MKNSNYQHLLTLIHELDDINKLKQLFDAILTEKEQKDLANRIQIFAMLQAKKPQREISEHLGVGIATVSRGAKAYRELEVASLLPTLNDNINTSKKND